MLIASTGQVLQIVGTIVAIIAGLGAIIGAVAGAVYIVKSHQIKTNNDLADSAIMSLQGTLSALEARQDIAEQDRKHCEEMRKQQDIVIARLEGSMNELRSWVTARDLITDLTNMARSGFISLGADPKVLEVAPAGDH